MNQSIVVKYMIVTSALTGLFSQFVACGAKNYQVSVKEDVRNEEVNSPANDPYSEYFGIHSPNGWSNLPINIYYGANVTESQSKAIGQAMKTWELLTGRTLFNVVGKQASTSGDSFKDLYSSLDDFINGHYLDFNWTKTGKNSMVLATTVWNNSSRSAEEIATADIRYNVEYYNIDDSLVARQTDERDVVDAQSLALHELGHLLGLSHVESEYDAYSIMNPYLYIGENLTARKPSYGDIQRIQKIYGCNGDACDAYTMSQNIEHGSYANIGIN